MTETNIEKVKALLLQEQRGKINKEEIIEEIAMGRNPLLTANDIANRLSIPIEVFHQWVKNADQNYQIPANSLVGMARNTIINSTLNRTETNKFAKPDFYIGNYPRWTLDTFKTWLRANLK
ncbi:hypothetical protein [Avibacterium paragallinarum]|uniref:Uncharacterized protein n=1 Tax=Avibacterium paragallinarum TaxID=728 RepID=A0A380X2J8_AVIPA|nr:hypothetical protein [Avibacterium paragallinarum]QZP14660.1 hypothetical protein K5O18_07320 [Avibacterium paragallinarum]UXN37532.1 hypothetical protein N8E87_03410 [Avibacterium paragallinarum]WAL56731.1 hypothetical protein OY678_12580 [Avibacterium paragallinarum]WAM59256.1 hypothetical protein OW731_12300 [Avibacterium paragallinarum]SUU97485.1 Uncharacterised protein [Avibacterium paragallinarum]